MSPSLSNDKKLQKLVECMDVPMENLFKSYDEEILEALFQMVEDDFEENIANNRKPNEFMIFFDDLSSTGIFKGANFNIINTIFSRGRHIHLSVIITAQKATDIPTNSFENMTMGVFFNCSDRQLEKIEAEVNYNTNRKYFKKKFRETTKERHSFFLVDFTSDASTMYKNKNFEPIDMVDPKDKDNQSHNDDLKIE